MVESSKSLYLGGDKYTFDNHSIRSSSRTFEIVAPVIESLFYSCKSIPDTLPTINSIVNRLMTRLRSTSWSLLVSSIFANLKVYQNRGILTILPQFTHATCCDFEARSQHQNSCKVTSKRGRDLKTWHKTRAVMHNNFWFVFFNRNILKYFSSKFRCNLIVDTHGKSYI